MVLVLRMACYCCGWPLGLLLVNDRSCKDDAMNINRRKFLQLVGASFVAVAVLPSEIKSIPKLWGDGNHNDTAGFQALLDGKPFEWMGNGRKPHAEFMPQGTFVLDKAIKIYTGSNQVLT